jgi:hypothetical protein
MNSKEIWAKFTFNQIGKSVAILVISHSGFAIAQKIPDVVVAPKGQTINMSLQQGSKSNLSFGTNTSFGANLSVQSSPGMTATATSSFSPLETSITSQIGSNPLAIGKTTATISNLRAQGTGQTSVAGAPILANEANFASGEAVLDGVGATVSINLDPASSRFMVEVLPNVVGGVACNGSSGTACQYTDVEGKKPYADQQFASGNSNANISSNTTVDIGSTQFTSTFAQSF